jgi:hypothetical protein
MRTTLDIDSEVLAAVKDLARRQNTSVGKTLSALARTALIQNRGGLHAREPSVSFHGFTPFAARDVITDNATLDGLRDQQGL